MFETVIGLSWIWGLVTKYRRECLIINQELLIDLLIDELLFSGVVSGKFAALTMFLFSLASCVGSVYLGYILFYILHDTCVVCISTYVVNACLFVINMITLHDALSAPSPKKKKNWIQIIGRLTKRFKGFCSFNWSCLWFDENLCVRRSMARMVLWSVNFFTDNYHHLWSFHHATIF